MSGDRRAEKRRSLEQPCWIDNGEGVVPTVVTLRDVSSTGAQLICEAPDSIPKSFNLSHVGRQRGSQLRGCAAARAAMKCLCVGTRQKDFQRVIQAARAMQ